MSRDPARRRAALVRAFSDIGLFSRAILRRPLRSYQLAAAQAIVASILGGQGRTFAVMMARQAGKNETAAQVEAFLLNLRRRAGGYIVKAAPTYRPQSLNSLQRLRAVLAGSPLPPLQRDGAHMLRCGRARIAFYSAAPGANVVGATADILLEADEAQDIDPDKWHKDFTPMGAATDATTVLWGTAWTADTLLARTILALREQEARDGVRRVFRVPWQVVAEAVPAYGRHVRRQIARLGMQHPLIRTQYLLEEIDDVAGMFPASTQALMRRAHPRQQGPTEGRAYALLIDVAGEALAPDSERAGGRRDSTVATVVEIAQATDPWGVTLASLPRYLVMERYLWTGAPHHDLAGALAHLADLWGARHVVIDATGVGAGLASTLRHMLGARVIPFVFSAQSKSRLGWEFLGLCNSGRFIDHRPDDSPEQQRFWREVAAARYELADGPNQQMRWGVPDPAIHDDLLISAALCAALPQAPLPPTESHIVEAEDPL
jgi:hypothetical protein